MKLGNKSTMIDYGNLLLCLHFGIACIVVFSLIRAIYKWKDVLYDDNNIEDGETETTDSGLSLWKPHHVKHGLEDDHSQAVHIPVNPENNI